MLGGFERTFLTYLAVQQSGGSLVLSGNVSSKTVSDRAAALAATLSPNVVNFQGGTQTATGNVQFSVNGNDVGSPVAIDSSGVGKGTVVTHNPDGASVQSNYDQELLKKVSNLGTDGSVIGFESYGYDDLGGATSSSN